MLYSSSYIAFSIKQLGTVKSSGSSIISRNRAIKLPLNSPWIFDRCQSLSLAAALNSKGYISRTTLSSLLPSSDSNSLISVMTVAKIASIISKKSGAPSCKVPKAMQRAQLTTYWASIGSSSGLGVWPCKSNWMSCPDCAIKSYYRLSSTRIAD